MKILLTKENVTQLRTLVMQKRLHIIVHGQKTNEPIIEHLQKMNEHIVETGLKMNEIIKEICNKKSLKEKILLLQDKQKLCALKA